MRLRFEVIAWSALAITVAFGAAALGARRARRIDADPRRSTLLAGPAGAQGYGEALQRLGVRVARFRRTPTELRAWGADSAGTVVAVLGPATELSVYEAHALIETPVDLLLAGPGTSAALRCLGYRYGMTRHDTVRTRGILVALETRQAADSSSTADGVPVVCTGPAPVRVDTLLAVRDGAAALRLTYADNRAVTLVADDRLFSNRALRTTEAGPFALGLVVPRYDRAVIDEYHHGFAASGSLAGAVFDWSVRSPWGWAAWQLGLVGLLALLVSGVRFGPARSVIDRRRRSPLEHVRALATALSAARGHTIAVELMVRGLRRRLARGQPGRDDPRRWLDGLADSVRTAEGRQALATLQQLTGRPVDAEGARRAAHAVEDVWEELSTTHTR